MATQKEMRQMRVDLIEQLMEKELAGFEVVGQISDGVLLQTEDGTYAVVKPIIKKEGFDAEDSLAEFEEKEQARIEREQEREAKKLAREKKKAEAEEE